MNRLLFILLLFLPLGCARSYTRPDSNGTEFSNDVRQCLMTLDYQIDPVDGPPFHYTLHDQIDSCLRARGWKP